MARASAIGREKEFAMASTALYEQEIVEDDIAPSISLGATASRTPFSWSAAIAGVFIAIAVSLIIIALGAGIGLSFASPYGGPSGTTLTLASAIWLVMAQSMGFATGGYVAARLRSPAHDGVVGETTFRDGAQGVVVWALGVVILAAVTGWLTVLGARFGANLATAGTVAASANSNESANGAVGKLKLAICDWNPMQATALGLVCVAPGLPVRCSARDCEGRRYAPAFSPFSPSDGVEFLGRRSGRNPEAHAGRRAKPA